jgi:hypothetical protein
MTEHVLNPDLYEVREFGLARLELLSEIHGKLAFSDFCASANTIEFPVNDAFLDRDAVIFRLTYPGYELEASTRDGKVFFRRNGAWLHSGKHRGLGKSKVMIEWDVSLIGCGVAPMLEDMAAHVFIFETPPTVPPAELVRTLRTENLLVNSAYRSGDDLFTSVIDCIHLCEMDIRRHGAERFAWGKNNDANRPNDEPEISRLVATFLSVYGAARNFDVSCEPRAGSGNVDFWVVGPVHSSGLAKIAIEAKKADHSAYRQGFVAQLPEYMHRLGATHGIFLTYWLRSPGYPYPSLPSYGDLEASVLHPLPRLPGVRTLGIDLSRGPTPSRA